MSATVLGWLFGGWSFGKKDGDANVGRGARERSVSTSADVVGDVRTTSSHDVARETAWIAAIQHGDADALDALLTCYYDELKTFAASIVRDADVAQDILQEVFFRIWKARAHGLRTDDTPALYLYRAVRNRALDMLRGNRRATGAMAAETALANVWITTLRCRCPGCRVLTCPGSACPSLTSHERYRPHLLIGERKPVPDRRDAA